MKTLFPPQGSLPHSILLLFCLFFHPLSITYLPAYIFDSHSHSRFDYLLHVLVFLFISAFLRFWMNAPFNRLFTQHLDLREWIYICCLFRTFQVSSFSKFFICTYSSSVNQYCHGSLGRLTLKSTGLFDKECREFFSSCKAFSAIVQYEQSDKWIYSGNPCLWGTF